MENFSEMMERSFVELVDKRVDTRGWRKGDFAKRVWPEASPKSAAGKWAAIRGKASNTGKPQGVLISDAQRMAEVLGEDLTYLLAVAKENAKKQVP
jgi:hypothetical protein